MKDARKVMSKAFLQIAVKLRWRKLINEARVKIRDARRRIKKFYRRRYVHYKVLAEIDNRIHTKRVKAEQAEVEKHRRLAKGVLKQGINALFKKKYAEIKKYREDNRERLLAEAKAKKEEERLQKIEDERRAAEERERQRIEAERLAQLRREEDERKDKLRREEQAAADKKADEERKYKLELAKMEMEEKRYEREAAAAAALVAAESKKGNQFAFEVPEDADMSNPVFAFSKCMADFQA